MDRKKPVGLFYFCFIVKILIPFLLHVKCKIHVHWILSKISTQFLEITLFVVSLILQNQYSR